MSKSNSRSQAWRDGIKTSSLQRWGDFYASEKRTSPSLALLLAFLIIISSSGLARAERPFHAIFNTLNYISRRTVENQRPVVPADPGVERVAGEIDWLEHLIERYGTIVPKHPDIWGEARLTKHRWEYEKELAKYFKKEEFQQTIQGAIRRSDQSYLSLAFTLSQMVDSSSKDKDGVESVTKVPVSVENTVKLTDPTDSKAIARSESNSPDFSHFKDLNFSLEPTIGVDQFSRYLNNLAELRRVNEGDDTADSPGYALNLMRVPVSVLPGRLTRNGYGGEVTFTVSPQFGDNMLPDVMRELVVNEIALTLGIQLVPWFNNDPEHARAQQLSYDIQSGRVKRWAHVLSTWFDECYQYSLDPSVQEDGKRQLRKFLSVREYIEQRLLQIAKLANDADLATATQAAKIAKDKNEADNASELNKLIGKLFYVFSSDQGQLYIEWKELAAALDGIYVPDQKSPSRTEALPPERLHGESIKRPPGESKIPFSTTLKVRLIAPSETKTGPVELLAKLTHTQPVEVVVRLYRPEEIADHPEGLTGRVLPIEVETSLQAKSAPTHDLPQPLKQPSPPADSSKNSGSLDALKEIAKKLGVSDLSSIPSLQELRQTAGEVAKQWVRVYNSQNSISKSITLDLSVLEDANRQLGGGAEMGGDRVTAPLIPHREFFATYGVFGVYDIAHELWSALTANPANIDHIHWTDIENRLKELTLSAHEFLCEYQGGALWRFSSPELVAAIRGHDENVIRELRKQFEDEIGELENVRSGATGALAWAVIVNTAIANQRLGEDMSRLATAKGCSCLANAQGLNFGLPRALLSPEAQEMFRHYVNCRWPIIAFALDPVTQDQNIADVFGRRRELQMSAAVALATGNMSPQAAGKFVRRLETDIETIALNRTAVAFSHGNDTFGWRFYPRLQTPDTPGGVGAFAQTLLGGPRRDGDIRQRELEPATRECTVVVVMPSFVPFVSVESRANWFSLLNPEQKAMNLHDTMRISRAYQQIHNNMFRTKCDALYRPGDVGMMHRTLEQLDRRLPLQRSVVQVPHINSLTARDMFETGATSLRPRLLGWYGAPGISEEEETTLFLIGDKFSVLETKIVAGGKAVDFEMLSRRLLRVTIPKGVSPINDPRFNNLVDIHLGTPHGPSNHLLVPMVKAKQPPGASPPAIGKLSWKDPVHDFGIKFTEVRAPNPPDPGEFKFVPPTSGSFPELRVNAPSPALPVRVKLGILVSLPRPMGEAGMASFEVEAHLDPTSNRYLIAADQYQIFVDSIKKAVESAARLVTPKDGDLWSFNVRGVLKQTNALSEQIDGTLHVQVKLQM